MSTEPPWIKEAKRLVQRGATVLEAALAVGYVDPRGLQRAAKKVEGRTPSSWARTSASLTTRGRIHALWHDSRSEPDRGTKTRE